MKLLPASITSEHYGKGFWQMLVQIIPCTLSQLLTIPSHPYIKIGLDPPLCTTQKYVLYPEVWTIPGTY